jgi:predicted transcriptional regulator
MRPDRTLTPLRVSPELRAAAEAVLAPGESLSSFVHDAVTRTIEYRNAQQAFVERGLASAERARSTERYVSRSVALRTLRRQLAKGRSAGKQS